MMKCQTRWRVQEATAWIGADNNLSVKTVVHSLGYASPFAFSKAYKRLTVSAPIACRKLTFDQPV